MGKSKLEIDVPAGQQQMLQDSTESHDQGSDTSKARYLRLKKRLAFISCLLLVATVVMFIVFILAVTGVIPVRKTNDKSKSNTLIQEESYGDLNGHNVNKYALFNKASGMRLEVINYGATITSLQAPDKHGKLVDVVLGYANLNDYVEDLKGTYFGTVVGRYANRIGNGRFEVDGTQYQVTVNNNGNALHGGIVGWNKAVWESEVKDGTLYMSHMSKDGDQGFPGEIETTVTFELTDDHEVKLKYSATSDKATPINLTTHPYFNLGGEGTGTIYDHNVTIYADRYTPVDDNLIPTGEIVSVNGTIFDLRHPTKLDDVINEVEGGGYDHNFCTRGPTGIKLAAKIHQINSGIEMSVLTDQPGMQFYTGNFLDVANAKNGHSYPKHSGFCMETQNYPDSPNHANFPDSILREGSEYRHTVIYRFGVISMT